MDRMGRDGPTELSVSFFSPFLVRIFFNTF
jgi:hypothetical protein